MDLQQFLGTQQTDEGASFVMTREMYGAFDGAFGGLVAAASLSAARLRAPGRRPIALDCRFLRGLPAGTVRATTTLVREGRTMTVVDTRIDDEEGRPAATATASFVDVATLHDLDDAGMVRPGASVAYAEASPFQLRRADAPVITTLGPRVKLTAADLVATVLPVPWDEPGTAPEASCLVADLAVGPPIARELAEDWVPHPNPDLSLRFTGLDAGPEVAGVARLERVVGGVAAVRLEVFSGIELLAVGCASALLLGMGVRGPSGERPSG